MKEVTSGLHLAGRVRLIEVVRGQDLRQEEKYFNLGVTSLKVLRWKRTCSMSHMKMHRKKTGEREG